MSVRLNQRRNFSHALKSTNRRVGKPANRTNQRWMRAIWIYLVRLNDHRTHLITHSFDWFLLPPPFLFFCLFSGYMLCVWFESLWLRGTRYEESHPFWESAREMIVVVVRLMGHEWEIRYENNQRKSFVRLVHWVCCRHSYTCSRQTVHYQSSQIIQPSLTICEFLWRGGSLAKVEEAE